jgi:hypothetical protein
MSEDGNKRPNSSDGPAALCAGVVLLVNAALAWSQFRDHFSWGAMQIAFLISPLVNCTLLFASMVFTPTDSESRAIYLSVAIILPLLLIPCQLALFVMR